ncbi:hypothetical protein C9J01_14225 [Photobacterium rosenbergii]|uniref:Outer membrane porin, OprD family n=1 Tax=Photobacterium rosenbergii TaxID=294936 RepID=A0A2T3NDR8_9GAMM|nr:OprD family outer membrane porin [Photobacterium rosenbergii]PSW12327.1 hypothetical protein C9J01_14225 [Photobacterium rosenbergii]
MTSYLPSKYTCLAAVISSSLAMPALANVIDDSTLNLQLRNELRNADRPSVSPQGDMGPKIDAWVQGFLFDFESGQFADTVSFGGGFYAVEKLKANPNRGTRMYLDGHDSFSFGYANVAFDFAEQFHLTVGQFGTDYYYGTLEHMIPFIDDSSNRTTPSLKEGALYQGQFGNVKLYGLYSQRVAGVGNHSWTDDGRIVVDWSDFSMEVEKEPYYAVGLAWDTNDYQLLFGTSYQNNVANQIGVQGSYNWLDSDNAYFKYEARAMYFGLLGDEKDLSEALSGEDSSYVVSNQLTYHKDRATFLGNFGYTGPKMASANIDNDWGYSFDMSIDRGYHEMFAWSLMGVYQFTDGFNVALSGIVTDGYKDSSKETEIEGFGANLIFSYTPQSGPLAGLRNTLVLNKAQEYRHTGGNTETLKYYDIKFSAHYDLKIF